jgi:CubicO group peptidase (beta-lactamase class C family)
MADFASHIGDANSGRSVGPQGLVLSKSILNFTRAVVGKALVEMHGVTCVLRGLARWPIHSRGNTMRNPSNSGALAKSGALGVVALAGGLFVASCSAAETDLDQAAAQTIDLTATIAQVDASIPGLMEEAGVSGYSIAVTQHGEMVWSQAYGLASVEPERATETSTIFEAASLGKVVLALVTLRLADQGVIDLDEPLADTFAYPLLDHDPRYAQLTPRIILHHASGLPNWGGYPLNDERDPVAFDTDPEMGYQYSGEAYTALQAFVEHRSGRGFEDLFQEIAAEAGMTDSSFISWAAKTDQYARAANLDGPERDIMAFDRPGAAYSLVSTAEDLARFTAYYFQGGGMSNAAYNASLETSNGVADDAWGASIPDGATITWTTSWGLQEIDGERIYLHAGNNGQFRAFMAYSADRDIAVAVMANGQYGLGILSDVLNPLLGDVHPAAVWWRYEAPAEVEETEAAEPAVE